MKEKILIADDDFKIRSLLSDILKEESFRVVSCSTTEDAWEKLATEKPNLILLDLEMPLKGGLEFCRELKEKDPYQNIPVIFLTVRDAEIDKVSGLNLGADDFITKPFRPRELVARINVVLRRYSTLRKNTAIIQSDSLSIDFERRVVEIKGKEIHLTPKEFDILQLLCKNRHRVMSDRMIFEGVWGAHSNSLLSTVYTHMDRLRKKLLQHGLKIRTISGVGYRFDERLK